MVAHVVIAGVVLLQVVAATRPVDQAKAAEELAARWEQKLAASRYMARGEGRVVSVPGWEGFETRRHTYSVKDKDGTVKTADVVMLNPSAGQIARWIVSAVVEVKGAYDAAAGDAFFRHVIGQSGGQFPVGGIVYEDILPADGAYEIFCFRDGVTVAVEGVEHRGTVQPTEEQVEAAISGKVVRVYRFGRVCSTSPEMAVGLGLERGGAEADVLKDGRPTEAWLGYVRRTYQAAWGQDRNPLFVAWLKGQG
jgi:hypothetical protein